MKIIPWDKYQKSLPKKRMAAGIWLLDRKGNLLMLKPGYKDHWTIPGGVIEEDESPMAAVIREVREETGLVIDKVSLIVVNYNRAEGVRDENIQWWFYALLDEKHKTDITIDEDEIIDFRFVTFKEASKLGNRDYVRLKPLIEKAVKEKMAVYLEDWKMV